MLAQLSQLLAIHKLIIAYVHANIALLLSKPQSMYYFPTNLVYGPILSAVHLPPTHTFSLSLTPSAERANYSCFDAVLVLLVPSSLGFTTPCNFLLFFSDGDGGFWALQVRPFCVKMPYCSLIGSLLLCFVCFSPPAISMVHNLTSALTVAVRTTSCI